MRGGRRLFCGQRLSERRLRRWDVPNADLLGRRQERLGDRNGLRRFDVRQVRNRRRVRDGLGLSEQCVQRFEVSGADV
jgi:hypothetical protein